MERKTPVINPIILMKGDCLFLSKKIGNRLFFNCGKISNKVLLSLPPIKSSLFLL